MLIEEGADADIKNVRGDTPLLWAAFKGNIELVRILVKGGANVNIQNRHGDTPLHFAARDNNIELTKILIEGRTDVNVQDNYGNTPLHYATVDNHKKLAKILVEGGANTNIKNNHGMTPLGHVRGHTIIKGVLFFIGLLFILSLNPFLFLCIFVPLSYETALSTLACVAITMVPGLVINITASSSICITDILEFRSIKAEAKQAKPADGEGISYSDGKQPDCKAENFGSPTPYKPNCGMDEVYVRTMQPPVINQPAASVS